MENVPRGGERRGLRSCASDRGRPGPGQRFGALEALVTDGVGVSGSETHPARLLPPRRCRGPWGRLRASRLPGGWTPVNVWPVRCDTRQLTEARCTEQTRNEREATVALRHCVRPLPVAGRPPHASLPCAWCSKDFGAFCHRDCPRGKRSNCRKCLVFLPLLREGKKKMQVKKSPSLVPRKAAKGPGNGPLRPGRP